MAFSDALQRFGSQLTNRVTAGPMIPAGSHRLRGAGGIEHASADFQSHASAGRSGCRIRLLRCQGGENSPCRQPHPVLGARPVSGVVPEPRRAPAVLPGTLPERAAGTRSGCLDAGGDGGVSHSRPRRPPFAVVAFTGGIRVFVASGPGVVTWAHGEGTGGWLTIPSRRSRLTPPHLDEPRRTAWESRQTPSMLDRSD